MSPVLLATVIYSRMGRPSKLSMESFREPGTWFFKDSSQSPDVAQALGVTSEVQVWTRGLSNRAAVETWQDKSVLFRL